MINDWIEVESLARIHEEMGLPEPLIWVHREPNYWIGGIIEGWIQDGVAAIDHMIVTPRASNRFRTMMQMSRDCTAACHKRGLDVVIKIARDDARHGLRRWAERCEYEWYAANDEFDYYVNRKEDHGQSQAAVSE